MQTDKKVVIAAGGEGKRMHSHFNKIKFKKSKLFYPVKGKEIIIRAIETALRANADEIFVLVKYYSETMKEFLRNKYKNNQKIKIVVSKEDEGICEELLSIKENLRGKEFIFMDGNILFNSKLLDELFQFDYTNNKALFNIAVSRIDNAPTHSMVYEKNNKIIKISSRVVHDGLSGSKEYDKFYSMGIMGLSGKIWPYLKNNSSLNDLDLLVEKVFKKSGQFVKAHEYAGEWLGIHTENDLIDIDNKLKAI